MNFRAAGSCISLLAPSLSLLVCLQVSVWTKQYEATAHQDVPAMRQLLEWLKRNLPEDDNEQILIHGDFRMDNLIFHPTEVPGSFFTERVACRCKAAVAVPGHTRDQAISVPAGPTSPLWSKNAGVQAQLSAHLLLGKDPWGLRAGPWFFTYCVKYLGSLIRLYLVAHACFLGFFCSSP